MKEAAPESSLPVDELSSELPAQAGSKARRRERSGGVLVRGLRIKGEESEQRKVNINPQNATT